MSVDGGCYRWGDEWDDKPLAEQPIGRLLALASRSLGMAWARMADQTGMSGAGIGVLMVLDQADGLKSSEVARKVWSTPATITAVVNTLERDGYVERRRDGADRRLVRIYLTGKGRQRTADLKEDFRRRWRAAFDYVAPDDEPAVRRFLLATIDRFQSLPPEG